MNDTYDDMRHLSDVAVSLFVQKTIEITIVVRFVFFSKNDRFVLKKTIVFKTIA